MRVARCLLAVTLLGGCAYYNGMYNAERMAHEAVQAEAEGRTLQASTLWGQVAVKAESVVVHHPHSKWADAARLLRGRALERLGDCAGATAPLELAAASTTRPDVVEDATFLLGRCREQLGDPDGATAAFSRLTASKDPGRRQEALFRHGRSLRIEGEYQQAIVELDASGDARARGERAAALAGLGRSVEAMAITDSLIAESDTIAPWDSLLAAFARRDPERGSALVDRVVTMPPVSPATRARWLMQDGLRYAGTDPARAVARLDLAAITSQGSESGLQARFAAVRIGIETGRELNTLEIASRALDSLSKIGGPISAASYQLGLSVTSVLTGAGTVPSAPQGDLRLFLAAETARDSLAAPQLAAALFDRLTREWPASPYAPKALLALGQLRPDAADSLRSALQSLYPESPYLALTRGEDSPAYVQLEDSLRVFATTVRVAPAKPVRGRAGTRPTGTREPDSDQ